MSFNKQGNNSAATQGGDPFNTGSDFGEQNVRGGPGVGDSRNYSHNVLDQGSYDQNRDYGKASTGVGMDGNTRGTQTGELSDYSTSGQGMGTGNTRAMNLGHGNSTSGYGSESGGRSQAAGAGMGYNAAQDDPRGRSSQSEGNLGRQEKPSATDKLVGGAQKMAGKVTSNTGMYERGQEKTGDTGYTKQL
ncbi:hypothetical protein CPB83DRAFT_861567 [Crepidotus variabilis]|uniref:Uncharacterized protein n=1 Tax=Crepidotus variabilis TaxID=179855 RepID=A0A9P6JL23_9AGAR|nr:hypothetical protein CPB83DRAFT_861567 [Crepidotus variabilis]